MPPQSTEILESYAKALKLEPESQEWHTFLDLAATATGRLPRKVMENPAALERLPQTLLRLSGQRTRSGPWTQAAHLELWADSLDARARLPQLVRRLIHATIEPHHIQRIEFPAYEGIQRPGWDGIVATTSGTAFVPAGVSVWEMGTDKEPRTKAKKDSRKRDKDHLGFDPHQVTFIFVTPRKWTNKHKWRDEKRALGIWGDVQVYDSANLEEWLETAPAVDVWMARHVGSLPEGVIDIEEHWKNLSALTRPSLYPAVFLTSREKDIARIERWLAEPPSALAFEALSPTDTLDFLAAYVVSREQTERDKRASRMVMVSKEDQWGALCAAHNNLVLIPKPQVPIEAEMVAEAVRQGHYVLLSAHRFAGEHLAKHELSRPFRHDLERALVASDINTEEAHQFARKIGGSLSALKRHLARNPSTALPEWSQPSHAKDFIPLLLAGGWDDANTGDRAIIAELARRSYDEVLATAAHWLRSQDAPLLKLRTYWLLVSHEDSWALLDEYLIRPQLDLFEKVAVEVLSADDPRHESSPRYSSLLRDGIAETLALLGVKSARIKGELEPVQRAERVVRQLLAPNTSWKRWASNEARLPALAEAAPRVFLDALKESHPPELPADKGAAAFSEALPGLVSALETLAWSPDFLLQVSEILARLTGCTPGGRWDHLPITSLTSIFMPWRPQTTAPVARRIKILEHLTRTEPEVGWRFLSEMSLERPRSSRLTHRPRWQDWILNWAPGVTDTENRQQTDACARMLIDLVGGDLERWFQVIEKFEHLPLSAQDRLLAHLDTFAVENLDTGARKRIADELRAKITKHRGFPDAWWVLPVEKLDALEVIKERFEPQDLIARHSWLFTARPTLYSDPRESWEQKQKNLFQLRQEALRAIFARNGLPGVFALVEAFEEPWEVGFAFGKARFLETDSAILPSLLLSENQKMAAFALGYGRGCFAHESWEWIDHLGLSQWRPEQAGRLLVDVPRFERKTWDIVEHLGAGVEEQYWRRAFNALSNAAPEDMRYAVAMLLKYHRPFPALRILEMFRSHESSIDSSLLMRVLEAGLTPSGEKKTDAAARNQARFEIQELFQRLQSDPNVDEHRLAMLEWGYLDLLDSHSAAPRTLLRLVRTSPRWFAELLNIGFSSENEPEEPMEPLTEEQTARARNAYTLVEMMTREPIPGRKADNTVDAQVLSAWVTEARERCRESGRLWECDSHIGEMLAHAPEESDGTWPCIAVRDVIEDVDSARLVRGFYLGTIIKPGLMTKSPFVSGDQERALAEKYRTFANACTHEWPITADALRKVANHHEEDARREDEQAKWRSLR